MTPRAQKKKRRKVTYRRGALRLYAEGFTDAKWRIVLRDFKAAMAEQKA